MSAYLFRKNQDGTIERVSCNPRHVSGMLESGFKSRAEDFEEEKPKRKTKPKKQDKPEEE